jgi:hypothetical protein
MGTYKLLVAAVLITSPCEDEAGARHLAECHEALAPAVRCVAMQWELLDPRETHFLLAQAKEFPGDIKVLQERYRDLRAAPPLAESHRFPSRDVVNDLLSFNRSYRHDLSNRLSYDQARSEELRAALTETDQLYRVWDTVRDARCEYYYVTVRRQALLQLRQLVGDPAFYSGQLPPHVPVWRFRQE